MKNILVFFGGKSSEHDVSVITGVLALNGTDREKYNALPVYIDKDGLWYTGKALNDVEIYKNLDVKKLERVTLLAGDDSLYAIKNKKLKKLCDVSLALNCTHGMFGEDGTLEGILKLCKIPSASPSVSASAVSMDKALCKDVAKSHNVHTLPYLTVTAKEFFSLRRQTVEKIKKKFGYPVIVKPTRLGSSIGIGIGKTDESLIDALFKAFRYDTTCIIERKLIKFTEASVACYSYGGELKISAPEVDKTKNEILNFADKYSGGGEKTMNGIKDEKTLATLKRYTEKLYTALKAKGVIRVDYLIENGKVYFNEVNAVPGSLAYYFYCESTFDLPYFLNELYDEAFSETAEENNLTLDYKSDVLSIEGVKGCKTKRG